MNREAFIYMIIQALLDNETLDVRNYCNELEQCQDVKKIIERQLEGYVIVKGEVI